MNLEYKVIYHKSAVKFIAKLDNTSHESIGSLRVIFNIDHQDKVVFIKAVGNRGDIYK